MVKLTKQLAKMRNSPTGVRFDDLAQVCDEYFGEPRHHSTSHRVYRTPWLGDPRVNIQRGSNGEAKAYQVRQVLAAIDKLTIETQVEQTNDQDDQKGSNDER